MEKLKFEFLVKSAEDGKTNIMAITTITTSDDRVFKIPAEMQPASLHEQLINTPTYTKIKNTLKRRHQTRKVWINVTEDLAEIYMDDDGNMQFKDYFLEEIPPTNPTAGISEESLSKVLEKLSADEYPNLKKIAEKFVLEKFSAKNSNANQWMTIFESECDRFDICKDEEKIEVLRLFLEKSCLDWYSSMLIKLSLASEWGKWKENFCGTYANKGWAASRYAISFRYKTGSLLDYALKKERLLLEIRKSIDTGTLIDLIAEVLPHYIADRIDREKVVNTEELYSEIRKLEHLVSRKTIDRKNVSASYSKEKEAFEKKKPCKICEKENRGTRYHTEATCWFKNQKSEKEIKHVNNNELEWELNDMDPKNL
ncbi:PREDICTED: uncharacterized protein LOC108359032 [Rhagoletis zephyria]|uniref:uncharacterized protein LOC108359032 n=1 Tax=Rhagoletis zephyria TaxID=28612 RepID=UPI000811AAEE|nr:PREDICTED: uncharacterized protein LOC108359032 [Rhagoletis zephyria]XP_017466148.1 PREDICTED: uncharacterized protein LOC108359032 [Rhagoletis zephyria]